jgi:hypothetical protein
MSTSFLGSDCTFYYYLFRDEFSNFHVCLWVSLFSFFFFFFLFFLELILIIFSERGGGRGILGPSGREGLQPPPLDETANSRRSKKKIIRVTVSDDRTV